MHNSSRNYKIPEINFCINLLKKYIIKIHISYLLWSSNSMTRIQETILLFIYHFITSEMSHKVFSLSYVVFYLQEIRIVASSDYVYCSHYASFKKKHLYKLKECSCHILFVCLYNCIITIKLLFHYQLIVHICCCHDFLVFSTTFVFITFKN